MLLAVLTCQSATDTAKRHWPTWQRYFDDIVFVTTIDSNCWVPDGIEAWQSGRDYYPNRDHPDDNLPKRTLQVLARFLTGEHDSICIIEYDVVLFRKPELSEEFSGTMFPEFIHSPWVLSRYCAEKFLESGLELMRNGHISGGWPDRHLRDIYDIVKPATQPNYNFSRNTLDQQWMLDEARRAVEKGAFAIHGIKTKEQFESLTK